MNKTKQKSTELKRTEFDEVTIRIRRNFMAISATIIFIKMFCIKVNSVLGMEFNVAKGVDKTDIILELLAYIMFYNFASFTIRAYEHFMFLPQHFPIFDKSIYKYIKSKLTRYFLNYAVVYILII